MAPVHELYLEFYGNNENRLTGKFETSSKTEFTYGVGNRSCSIRIPTSTISSKKGYIEDRRPASDMDPYVVTALIANTIVNDEDQVSELR